jgi:DNA-binding NarL/FixJ family response regulator
MNMIDVIIVDDDPQFRQEIRTVLERLGKCIVVGESNTSLQVVEMAQRHHPDIVLLNGDLNASDTLEIARLLRSYVAMIGIIILTQFPDEELLFQFLKVGANAYTTRTISPEILIETIRRVNSGEFLFSDEQVASEPFLPWTQRD